MNNLLLDANIVSYLMRSDPLARLYRPHLANHSLAISFMTLAELYEGAFRGNWGAEKRRYLDEIHNLFVVIPSGRKLCSRRGRGSVHAEAATDLRRGCLDRGHRHRVRLPACNSQLTASSRNLLSLGSRQSLIRTSISTHWDAPASSARNCLASSSVT